MGKSRENVQIVFKVSIREKKKLKTEAIKHDMTLNDYLRSLIFNENEIIEKESEDI